MTDLNAIAALKLKKSTRDKLTEAGITTIGELEARIDSQQIDDIVGPTTKARREIDEMLVKYKSTKGDGGLDKRFFVLGCVFAGVTLLLLIVVPIIEFLSNKALGPGSLASLLYLTSITGGFAAAMFEGRLRLVQKIPLVGDIVPEFVIDATAGFAVFLILFFWSPFRRDTPPEPVSVSIVDEKTNEPISRFFSLTDHVLSVKKKRRVRQV